MSDIYRQLNYKRDVTGRARVGQILGQDAFGRPFEVIDAEYDPATDMTAVHLQYATAETIRAEWADEA